MMNEKIKTLNNKELRNFGLITGGILVGLFGMLPFFISGKFHLWPFVIAGLLWLFALLAPLLLRPVYHLWMKFGHVMGFINTRIILGVMFFFIVTPVGYLLKLFGKDPMNRVFQAEVESYRVESMKKNKNHVERIF